MKDYYGHELKVGDEVFPMEDFEALNSNVSYKILGFPGENNDGGYIELKNERGERMAYGSRAFVFNPAGGMFRSEEATALVGNPAKSDLSDRSDS